MSFKNWLEISVPNFPHFPERSSTRKSQSELDALKPISKPVKPELSSEVPPSYDEFVGNLQKLLDIMDWDRKNSVAIKQALDKTMHTGNSYLKEL